MGSLALNFLGDLSIARDGEPLELPPSRKTRALLAYLALTSRAFRREHLCELLWEIPDDPRGSLRWSLSKLRRLVDDEARERIVADRIAVRFDASEVAIDVAALASIAQGRLDEAPLDAKLVRLGSMFWIAWNTREAPRSAEALDADAAKIYARVFHSLLDQGIALAPSAFEIAFLSLAHTRRDIDRLAEGLRAALAMIEAEPE